MYLYLFIYLFIFYLCVMCGLALCKVSLQVISPRMIVHCKHLGPLILLVYTKICKIV